MHLRNSRAAYAVAAKRILKGVFLLKNTGLRQNQILL